MARIPYWAVNSRVTCRGNTSTAVAGSTRVFEEDRTEAGHIHKNGERQVPSIEYYCIRHLVKVHPYRRLDERDRCSGGGVDSDGCLGVWQSHGDCGSQHEEGCRGLNDAHRRADLYHLYFVSTLLMMSYFTFLGV